LSEARPVTELVVSSRGVSWLPGLPERVTTIGDEPS
jgi:hypothetical protein